MKKKTVVAPESVAPFKAGDVLVTAYKPVLYDIFEPCVAESVQRGVCASGWLVEISTTAGMKQLDSGHFKRAL